MSLNEIGSEYFNLTFPNLERPEVEKGGIFSLCLIDEGGEIHNLTVEVTDREDFPESYRLFGRVNYEGCDFNLEMYISRDREGVTADWARIWRRNVVGPCGS